MSISQDGFYDTISPQVDGELARSVNFIAMVNFYALFAIFFLVISCCASSMEGCRIVWEAK